MKTYIVKRQPGRYWQDYLLEWDVIWGPVWTGSRERAKRFGSYEAAHEEAITAVAIMKPTPWCVPDFGVSPVFVELV